MDPMQQQIKDARRVLYNLDPVDGSIVSKSKLYKMYEKNAADYAKAKSDYATAMEKALSEPATARIWPITAATYQQAVKTAYDDWVCAGKEEIERAINVIQSLPKNFSK